MRRTAIASSEDRREVLEFLARRRLENAWVIWFALEALESGPDWGRVFLCRRDSGVLGVALLSQRPVRDEAGPLHFDVHMDAETGDAAQALADALPPGAVGHFQLFTPETQGYLDGLQHAERHADDLYFTVSRERFRPVDGQAVVALTQSDDRLFDGCEQRPDWERARGQGRLYGIVLEGRAASSAWTGPITPEGALKPGVASIGALYTETRHRRRGLARRVVSCLTEMILEHGNLPAYWTESDNIPSQRLCQSLGYWQYAQKVNYVWRRP